MEGLLMILKYAVLALVVVTALVLFAERFAKGHVAIVVVGVLAGVTMVADILAGAKFIQINLFGLVLQAPAGVFVFPVVLLGIDYLNEFYGKNTAKFAVIGGWLAKIYMAVMFPLILSDSLPWAGFAVEGGLDKMTPVVLGMAPRIAIVSIIAYLIAGLLNVQVYAWLMKVTKGKHLWLRNNVSSNLAMLFDTVFFILGSFLLVLPTAIIFNMIIAQVIMKWVTNWVDTIFLYLMSYLKKIGIISGKEEQQPSESAAL